MHGIHVLFTFLIFRSEQIHIRTNVKIYRGDTRTDVQHFVRKRSFISNFFSKTLWEIFSIIYPVQSRELKVAGKIAASIKEVIGFLTKVMEAKLSLIFLFNCTCNFQKLSWKIIVLHYGKLSELQNAEINRRYQIIVFRVLQLNMTCLSYGSIF